MKFGIGNSLDFAVGLVLTSFGFTNLFKTTNFSVLIISIFLSIIGVWRLAKSTLTVTN